MEWHADNETNEGGVTDVDGLIFIIYVSDVFDGKSLIQRHKIIYTLLDKYIKTGEIHALTIKAMTVSESEK